MDKKINSICDNNKKTYTSSNEKEDGNVEVKSKNKNEKNI